jgi:hypothetical protein
MGGKQIDTYNRIAVEACIFVEVGDGLWKGYVQVDGTWVDEWTAWAKEATVATRRQYRRR